MEKHRPFLEMALAQAEQAAREGTYPVGAVLVGPDGQVVTAGRNRVRTQQDATAHAEVDVIRRAGALLFQPPYRHGCTLYTSVEPCLMCTGAILLADIDQVVWAMSDGYGGALSRLHAAPPLWAHKFTGLQYIAAPFPDLDQRQRELMAAFDSGRGLQGERWLTPDGWSNP